MAENTTTQQAQTEPNVPQGMGIYNALTQISCNLAVLKSKEHQYQHFKYRDLPAIREALKPLLNRFSVALVPYSTINGEQMHFEMRCICYADGSEVLPVPCLDVRLDPHKGMSAEQACGAAATYAEKYLIGQVFHLDDDTDETDPDNDKVAQNDSIAVMDRRKEVLAAIAAAKDVDDLSAIKIEFADMLDGKQKDKQCVAAAMARYNEIIKKMPQE